MGFMNIDKTLPRACLRGGEKDFMALNCVIVLEKLLRDMCQYADYASMCSPCISPK
jgi:hypothetical protein